jgi:hypothetical protein
MTDTYTGEINPAFARSKNLIEPLYQRSRSGYRSPVSSESMNLESGLKTVDIEKLYGLYLDLKTKLQYQLDNIYNDGMNDIPGLSTPVETLAQQRQKLSTIRKAIGKMK